MVDTVLELRVVGYGDPDAVALVARVQEEYVERYGGPDETPVDPAMFEPPGGLFLVAYLDGVPVGTGAWRQSPVRALEGFGHYADSELNRCFAKRL